MQDASMTLIVPTTCPRCGATIADMQFTGTDADKANTLTAYVSCVKRHEVEVPVHVYHRPARWRMFWYWLTGI